ncbi:ribonuclease R [Dissulfurirhabdus thermomarina]|uniref:Ribonuclease R n=1 Tax=Dissulfurirhabdus thermomarina TaxID=1765737 RepID=A0A6N9TQ12_DISTH|nr:ribonuclease R [Dissulfurirhabdus thermomarina]NDY41824.1 ribonuclease R [Dissulfurirhabdus thermomarina]NMX22467.1 ribonuclease R [Dissulfurirhabdus thermomarina]
MRTSAKGRGRRGPGAPLEDRLISALETAGRPLFRREILHLAHVRPEDRAAARKALSGLVRRGALLLMKGRRYGLPHLMDLVAGRLSVHPDGFGFVIPDPGQKVTEDLFIPPKGLKGAVHGDRVVARVEGRRGKRFEASILRVVERPLDRVIGTFRRGRNVAAVIPEDDRLLFEVIIPPGADGGARPGEVVVAEIADFSPEHRNPEGRVTEVLGDPADLAVQTRIVIHKYELPHDFSPAARDQAEALPDAVTRDDLAGRKDLRELPLVTIDGADARDFDDAVCVRKTRTGYTLTVAIADVGHYVPAGSPLDEDALARGTSVYFPGAVVPMLPESLSNHLCSLVPGQDRLAMAVEIAYDRAGRPRWSRFFKAVIRSHRRFTYTEVKEVLVDRDPAAVARNREHLDHLEWMAELAGHLSRRRRRRGSIDFDLPEPAVVLGLRGELEAIVRRERNLAHQIIEEFMIAANEAVAAHLAERRIPVLYRVHEEPDRAKVRDFVEFARSAGLDVAAPEELTPRWFQEVLARAEGTPQEYVVNAVLLRSMQQAVYSPVNSGHFGLASPAYLHFTSPIRRYPDLVVHRVLKANLRGTRKRPVYGEDRLEELGRALSARERTALEAEREMLDRLKVRFMEGRVGEVFEGVVSGVASFGFFVELRDVFVEGAVRLVDLADDYYVLEENRHRLVGKRTGRTFQIGQVVRVSVKAVNVARRHINFELVPDDAS